LSPAWLLTPIAIGWGMAKASRPSLPPSLPPSTPPLNLYSPTFRALACLDA
jgi:hypothetical protein